MISKRGWVGTGGLAAPPQRGQEERTRGLGEEGMQTRCAILMVFSPQTSQTLLTVFNHFFFPGVEEGKECERGE